MHLKLSKKTIKSGALSDAQLEAIVYAGQAHTRKLPNGERQGFLIGDGTGLGKGREVADIIWDNWNHGRKKAVWILETSNLFKDAKRDIQAHLEEMYSIDISPTIIYQITHAVQEDATLPLCQCE